MGELRMILRDPKECCLRLAGILCLFILCSCSNNQVNKNPESATSPASQKAQHNNPGVKCTEDSPERRGEEGCTILTNRPLVGSSRSLFIGTLIVSIRWKPRRKLPALTASLLRHMAPCG